MSSNEYDHLGLIGHSFSVPEKAATKISLLVLGEKLQSKVALWGKILGIHGDYLIAQTQPENIIEPRLSFYSVDGGTNWVALATSLTEEQESLCEQLRGRFLGKPEFEYKVRKDIPPEPPESSLIPAAGDLADQEKKDEEDEEEPEDAEEHEEEEHNDADEEEEVDEELLKRKKNKPKIQILKLTEAVRVAHFVLIHDIACRLVVRGTYVYSSKTGRVVRNRTFEGHEVPQALKMRNYFKLSTFPIDPQQREGEQQQQEQQQQDAAADGAAAAGDEGAEAKPLTAAEKAACIASNNKKWFGPGYNAATDFLAPITEDCPDGVWTLKYDPSLAVVAIQNLYFLGSLFWYTPDSTQAGQLYYGTGERNLDLCFQLPGPSN